MLPYRPSRDISTAFPAARPTMDAIFSILDEDPVIA